MEHDKQGEIADKEKTVPQTNVLESCAVILYATISSH